MKPCSNEVAARLILVQKLLSNLARNRPLPICPQFQISQRGSWLQIHGAVLYYCTGNTSRSSPSLLEGMDLTVTEYALHQKVYFRVGVAISEQNKISCSSLTRGLLLLSMYSDNNGDVHLLFPPLCRLSTIPLRPPAFGFCAPPP